MITSLDKNTALVLIDLQVGTTSQAPAAPLADVVGNAAKLVKAFRDAVLPVVIVHVNPAGAAWLTARKDAKQPQRTISPDFLEIVPEIKTQPDDIFITKHTWGAFFETPLEEELKKRNITGIVLAGVSTSIGVEGTARQASERGFNVTFAKDAMMDMFPAAHENSLKYIFPRIGEVDDTDKIVEMLMG